ncbi:MAG: polar amino acid transport system substrate-binding protein [Oleispira sp.]|jgi:polar amino acid transport system substrate-binding protein
MSHLFAALLILLSVTVLANPLTIVTEQYPPYNYEEQGSIKGMSTEVVSAVLKELDLEVDIEIYPWARAYDMASTQENVLIYSISRTPQRESLFNWVGVIASIDFTIFALERRQDINIQSLEDIRAYMLGLVRGDALEQFFSANNFTEIERVNTNKQAMEMLLASRTDLWPISKQAGAYILKKNNMIPAQTVRAVFELEEFSSEDLYMAFSRSTNKKLVNDFKRALEKIKENGIYNEIISRYQ